MINRCVICGNHDVDGRDICPVCRHKAKLIYSTIRGKVFKVESDILYIGIFNPEELAYISENII